MKNIIIVTPHFPPSTLAGVHRARHLSKHLRKFGWNCTVLTVDPKFHAEKLDQGLANLVPHNVEVEQVAAIEPKLARFFGIGDITLRSFLNMRAALSRIVQQKQPDLVFITGAPFYFLLLAAHVRNRLRTPVVLDLQDPWVSKAGETAPRFSKRGMSHALAKFLEPKAVRYADAITSVSDVQNDQMRARYKFLSETPFAGIPIGGDPEDFQQVETTSDSSTIHQLNPDKLNFCFVGTFMPRSGPLMKVVFEAVHVLLQKHPELRSRLRLNFVGTSNQTSSLQIGPASKLAVETGIADFVRETTQRVPFLEALKLLRSAHALLLIGSDEQHYTASKIYPNLMSQTPYLSLFHEESSAHEILSAAGGGAQFSFKSLESLNELKLPIATALKRLIDTPESFGRADSAAYQHVTAESVAGRFADLFNRVVDESSDISLKT